MKLGEKAKIVGGTGCSGCFLHLREDAGLSGFDSCSQLATIRHGTLPVSMVPLCSTAAPPRKDHSSVTSICVKAKRRRCPECQQD